MLVSVVIPCYNVEDYISECIHSVLSQTYSNLEIICVDNNSTDETLKRLRQISAKYPSKIIVLEEFRKGAPSARNKGLSIAKGEWIQFLDADDLLEPDKINHQIQLLLNCPSNISFVAAVYKKRLVSGKELLSNSIESNGFTAPFINKCGITSSNLWRRQSVVDIQGWSEKMQSSQESDLMFRLILNNTNYLADAIPFTIIRQRESGQISQGDPLVRRKQYLDVRVNYIDEYRKHGGERFKEDEKILYDYLVNILFDIAKLDLNFAVGYFNTYIKNKWSLSSSEGFSLLKVLMIKIFGFRFYCRLSKRGTTAN